LSPIGPVLPCREHLRADKLFRLSRKGKIRSDSKCHFVLPLRTETSVLYLA
jgi:hypothetical protein